MAASGAVKSPAPFSPATLPSPRLLKFLFTDTRMSWLWLLVRIWVGWQWLSAGWEKLHNPAWVGGRAGTALHGFLLGALKQTTGAHPNVQPWYAHFLNGVALPGVHVFTYLVAFGETAVGVALILGVLTGAAAFFGCFMNLNYLLAGAVSTNPVLGVLGLLLMLGWRTAGWLGADRWILPVIGTPWHPGTAFAEHRVRHVPLHS